MDEASKQQSREGTSKMEIEFDSISGTKGKGYRERERGTIVIHCSWRFEFSTDPRSSPIRMITTPRFR